MVSPQKTQKSLQQRVNDLLHENPIGYAVETPKGEAAEAISSLLHRAEEDLKAAQERVDLLKWELEKARS
jgi:hypothetical protein